MNRYIKHRDKAVLIQILCILVLNCVVWTSLGAAEKFDAPAIISGKNLIQNQALQRTIEDYYYNELINSWKITYSYRRKEFQDTVPFIRYKTHMEKAFTGIDLVGIEIENVSIKRRLDGELYAELMIRFVEVITDESRFRLKNRLNVLCRLDRCNNGAAIKLREATVWITQGGEWKCLECGIRMRILLNGRMLYSE